MGVNGAAMKFRRRICPSLRGFRASDESINFLLSTTMNPWITDTAEGNDAGLQVSHTAHDHDGHQEGSRRGLRANLIRRSHPDAEANALSFLAW